jgi:hypothetical protein
MSKRYTAVTGLSYKSGGEYKLAAAGADVSDMDPEQVDAALKSGAIKEAAVQKAPPQKVKVSK